MSLWETIWPFGKKHREEVKDADDQLQKAIAEAMLRQGDLKNAAAEMKKAREEYKHSRESSPDRDPIPSSS